jgi:hypothetical protein
LLYAADLVGVDLVGVPLLVLLSNLKKFIGANPNSP